MEIYLKHYWHIGGIRKFDTSTGYVGKKEADTVEATNWGFVWKQKFNWYAIRRNADNLVFQNKEKIWPLREPFTFKVTGTIIRKFTIFDGTTRDFEIRYKPSGIVHQFFDPTYDAIDAESDDFFLYVCSMRDSWGEEGLKKFALNK